MQPPTKPPQASRRPVDVVHHGRTVVDEYAWMRERHDPAVRTHLEAENAHAAAAMADAEGLRDELYEEFRGRLPEVDVSVPVRRGSFLYGERLVEGAQYPQFWRRPADPAPEDQSGATDGPPAPVAANAPGGAEGSEDDVDADVEELLDLNALAGDGYLALGGFRVSPDENLLAYSLDRNGAELYELRIRDLSTGDELADRIPDIARGGEWSADSRYFFYVTRDAAHRPYRVYRHRLGTASTEDELIFEELDERFFLSLEKTRTGRYLVLTLGTHTTSEIHVLDAEAPLAPPRRIVERRDGVEWQLDHWHDLSSGGSGVFFLRTNADAPLGRLMTAPADDPASMVAAIDPRDDVVLTGVEAFHDFLVLTIRRDGLSGLEIRPLDLAGRLRASEKVHTVAFEEPLYAVAPTGNEVFNTSEIRFAYQSPLVPRSIFDYHVPSRTWRLRKRTVVQNFTPEPYTCRRLWAVSADGTRIPVSLIERRDRQAGGPALVYAYGSYGSSVEPRFSIVRLSLMDRGFAIALVHARGGGEMGRPWYEAAKMEHKGKTFDDVIAAAELLVSEGLATPRGLALRGGSAGGLMVGAVINRRPDLFHTAVAEVPFVDVLHTMLDPTIPLTVIEYEEWGNPGEDAEAFEWIASYSPYENVRAADYPHLLATAGFNDTRVQYWEPAKWVARLRRRKTDANLLLLKVEMGSGHVGASGRYNSLRQEAFKTAFMLHALEVERSDGAVEHPSDD
ncbi:MAG: S9 family peptidase [Acidobacteriota bacterium]